MMIVDVALFLWTGFTYTRKEKAIDTDSLQVSDDKSKARTVRICRERICFRRMILAAMNGKSSGKASPSIFSNYGGTHMPRFIIVLS